MHVATAVLIERDVSLRAFNSFGLQCVARQLARPQQLAELRELVDQGWFANPRPALWLGGGSNVLFLDSAMERVVLPRLLGRTLTEVSTGEAIVEAAASEGWHDLVMWALEQGWAGLENLALIPGSVGAAPIQNIGAYGVELAQLLDAVHVLDVHTGNTQWLAASACRLDYRDSLFKHRAGAHLRILAVRLRVHRGQPVKIDYRDLKLELAACGIEQPDAMAVAQAVMAIRKRKLPDPAQLGNAGSFFKNPVLDRPQAEALLASHPALPHFATPDPEKIKVSAAWLIDQRGWKGKRSGDAGVHAHHALVLVNHGAATGHDVWGLAQAIMADVQEHFGVALEPEPMLVGQAQAL